MTNEEIAQLEKHDAQLYQLITSASQSYLLARTLSDIDEKDYELDVRFIIYHENLYIKNTVIDLYKILYNNKNEQYNIFKYLRKIELFRADLNISLIQIEVWLQNLEKHLLKINVLTNLRSKYYAHIDSNHSEYLNTATETMSWDDYETS